MKRNRLAVFAVIAIAVLSGLAACRPSGSKAQAENAPALEEVTGDIPAQEPPEKPDTGTDTSRPAAAPAPELPDERLSGMEAVAEGTGASPPAATLMPEKPDERLSDTEEAAEETDPSPSAAIPELEMLTRQISGMKENADVDPQARALEALKYLDEQLSKTQPKD